MTTEGKKAHFIHLYDFFCDCLPVNALTTVPGQIDQHCAPPDYCQKGSDTLSEAQMTTSWQIQNPKGNHIKMHISKHEKRLRIFNRKAHTWCVCGRHILQLGLQDTLDPPSFDRHFHWRGTSEWGASETGRIKDRVDGRVFTPDFLCMLPKKREKRWRKSWNRLGIGGFR